MRTITKHIIHCSDSMHGDVEEITKWHKARGFKTIGYHFVILRSGEVQFGRQLQEIGAHTKGHNIDSIGTCLIGTGGKFTPMQLESLKHLHKFLKAQYPGIKHYGHRDFTADKSCPTFEVEDILGKR